ncbi:MAG TPA: hypothetical protein VM324_12160 [Egibacteraceae bacterium]|nr:hypothetical protein [Egibacteraceae bacterium]
MSGGLAGLWSARRSHALPIRSGRSAATAPALRAAAVVSASAAFAPSPSAASFPTAPASIAPDSAGARRHDGRLAGGVRRRAAGAGAGFSAGRSAGNPSANTLARAASGRGAQSWATVRS